jgi:phage baseplate assembly protein W
MIQGTADPAKAFLGVGWSFPPQISADGTLSEVAHEEDVRQAILIILQTKPASASCAPSSAYG